MDYSISSGTNPIEFSILPPALNVTVADDEQAVTESIVVFDWLIYNNPTEHLIPAKKKKKKEIRK